MTAQEYIMSTVEKLARPLVMEDIGQTPLQDAIYAKVMSKKFRKLKAAEPAVNRVKTAIELAIKENKPLVICQIFGGNKLWRFDEAPEIDWAELFSLTYFVEWMRGIVSVYEPGVIYEYYSQDISVESLNNVPRTETDRYSQTFRDMLQWIAPYIPKTIQVVYHRHFEDFDNPDDYYKEIEEAKKLVLQENDGQLPKLDDKMKLATEMNVKLKPDQADDPQWREKVELEHQAIFRTTTYGKHIHDSHFIYTCPTFYEDSVVTGSTKRSYAKFWAAVGALKHDGDSFNELVLTPKQLAEAKFDWEDINIDGLKGKNFSKIRVLK